MYGSATSCRMHDKMTSGMQTCAGDTIPLQTFVDFAQGSDVVIHESVGEPAQCL